MGQAMIRVFIWVFGIVFFFIWISILILVVKGVLYFGAFFDFDLRLGWAEDDREVGVVVIRLAMVFFYIMFFSVGVVIGGLHNPSPHGCECDALWENEKFRLGIMYSFRFYWSAWIGIVVRVIICMGSDFGFGGLLPIFIVGVASYLCIMFSFICVAVVAKFENLLCCVFTGCVVVPGVVVLAVRVVLVRWPTMEGWGSFINHSESVRSLVWLWGTIFHDGGEDIVLYCVSNGGQGLSPHPLGSGVDIIPPGCCNTVCDIRLTSFLLVFRGFIFYERKRLPNLNDLCWFFYFHWNDDATFFIVSLAVVIFIFYLYLDPVIIFGHLKDFIVRYADHLNNQDPFDAYVIRGD